MNSSRCVHCGKSLLQLPQMTMGNRKGNLERLILLRNMILDPVYVSQQCSTWGTLESHIHLYSHAKTNRLADNWERIKILSKRTERPVFNQYLHLWYHWMLIMSLPRADFFHVVNTRNTHFFPTRFIRFFSFEIFSLSSAAIAYLLWKVTWWTARVRICQISCSSTFEN